MGAWASAVLPQLVLLDNQLHDGRAGVRVYQLAAPEGVSTDVLVDLGWLPLPADRQLPGIVALKGVQMVQGLLSAPPSAGWRSTGAGAGGCGADLAGHATGSAGPTQYAGQARHFVAGPAPGPCTASWLYTRSGNAAKHAATRAALGLRGAMVRTGCRGPGDRDAADMACAPPPPRALTPAA